MQEEFVHEILVEMHRLKSVFRPERGGMALKPYEAMLLHCVQNMSEEGVKAFPSQIGEAMGFSRSFVAQILTHLEEMEYITRNTQKDDRRMSEIVLTEKGRTLMHEGHKGMHSKFAKLLERLGEEDCREMLRLCRRITEIMNEINAIKEE